MYRLERDSGYTLDNQRYLDLKFESESLTEVIRKFKELMLIPHVGKYFILKIEVLENERSIQDKIKNNKI